MVNEIMAQKKSTIGGGAQQSIEPLLVTTSLLNRILDELSLLSF